MSVTRTLPWMLASALVVGCAGNTSEETGAATAQPVDEVTDNPEDFIGRSVTVRGEMDDVRGLRAFTLEDHDWVFPEELLVIAPHQPAGAVSGLDTLEDREVTVRGTVRKLVVTDLEREFDFDLDPEFEVEFRDRPILIAEEITPDPSPGETAPGSTADTAAVSSITDVLLLVPVPGPAELVGKEARLTDAEVRSRAGDRGLWVGPSHTSQVFVRLADDAAVTDTAGSSATVDAGDRIDLSGTVRRVPELAEVQSDWGLDDTQAGLVARREALYIAADSVIIQNSE